MRGRRLELNYSAAKAHAAFLRAAEIVSAVTGVAIDEVIETERRGRPRRRRGHPKGFARRAAIYLAVCGTGCRAAALARALDRPRWRISDVVQTIELQRDQPAVDDLFARMEAML